MVEFKLREHSMPADLGRLKEARDFAERAATEFGLDGDACYDVKLAMSEAVTNAIQHGSSSPSDPIKIVVAVRRARSCSRCSTTGASGRAWCGAASARSRGAGSSSCAS